MKTVFSSVFSSIFSSVFSSIFLAPVVMAQYTNYNDVYEIVQTCKNWHSVYDDKCQFQDHKYDDWHETCRTGYEKGWELCAEVDRILQGLRGISGAAWDKIHTERLQRDLALLYKLTQAKTISGTSVCSAWKEIGNGLICVTPLEKAYDACSRHVAFPVCNTTYPISCPAVYIWPECSDIAKDWLASDDHKIQIEAEQKFKEEQEEKDHAIVKAYQK